MTAALTAAVVVFIDQLTKNYFYAFGEGYHQQIIKNVIELIHHENYGIIANVPLPVPITIMVTIIIMAVIANGVSSSVKRNSILEVMALAELFGGALGNFIDRIARGFVFDWILLFGQSAMNIADIAIIEGALVYIGWKWYEKRKKTAT